MKVWNKGIQFLIKNQVIIFSIIPLVMISAYFFTKEYKLKAEEAAVYLSEHSALEDIYFSSQNGYLQEARLIRQEDEDVYHAYIPTACEDGLKVYFQYCDKVILDGVKLSCGSRVWGIEEGDTCAIQALDSNGEVMEEGNVCFHFQGTIPTVYISTESGSMEQIDADKNYIENAAYAVYTQDGKLNAAGYGSIKGRGNTSWNKSQKPYNLNLDSSASLLGMEQKSGWALLADYGEMMPQLKNKVAFGIAQELGMPYTPEGEFVNLYLNGKYNGLYLLAGRVDIEPSEYVLEFDARYKEEINYFRAKHQRVVIKSPKVIEDPLQITVIQEYVMEAEEAVYSEDGINSQSEKHYTDYIDLDSWSKMYALQDFFVQWDVEYSSFYIYKKSEDEHLYAGPIWDFDLSCGRFYGKDIYSELTQNVLWIKDVKGEWLNELGEHSDFADQTKQRFINVISPAVFRFLNDKYADIVEPLDSAVAMAAVRWGKDKNASLNEIDRIYDWMLERQAFLNDYYGEPDSYCKVTFAFDWASIPYYNKRNTEIGFLPGVEESTENIVGWIDDQGNELCADTIITYDTVYYPVYGDEEVKEE